MSKPDQIRIAFFPDSFFEVNGVATTSKRLVEHARRNELPLLCVHAGPSTSVEDSDSVRLLSLRRSPARISMDEGLAFDPFFQRHVPRVMRELVRFKPDIIHITGLNDVSIVGAYLAWKLGIPLIGSWHTNLHEFAAKRLGRILGFVPDGTRADIERTVEKKIFDGAMLYYKMPKIVLAPNRELVDVIGRRTKRESRIMSRGVDTELFSPSKRTVSDDRIRLGFVGRLRAEKNPRILVDIERALIAAGEENYEFLVVGEGTERDWLEKNLKRAVFTGFLEGERLARAYADMDVFIFPSETDTFGNVAQEALASGVPVVVSSVGGPKFVIEEGSTGLVANSRDDFARHVLALVRDPRRLSAMKSAARASALTRSWDSVFETVWQAYRDALEMSDRGRGQTAPN